MNETPAKRAAERICQSLYRGNELVEIFTKMIESEFSQEILIAEAARKYVEAYEEHKESMRDGSNEKRVTAWQSSFEAHEVLLATVQLNRRSGE